jgi:hypothetical protein
MARRKEVDPVRPAVMPSRLLRYEPAAWMPAFEFAVGDPCAFYGGVADYIRQRMRWFEQQGEDRQTARRLALNDGGHWKAGLMPRRLSDGA